MGVEGKYSAIPIPLTAARARHTYMYTIKFSIVPAATNNGPQKYENTSPNVLNATATPVANPRSLAGNQAFAKREGAETAIGPANAFKM